MEHVKGYGRERTHTQTMDRLQVPKEGRTCQREEEEQGRGRGMWHGQEVLVMFRHWSALCSLLLSWKRHELSNETLRTYSVKEVRHKNHPHTV